MIKKILKWTGLSLLGFVIFGGAFAAHEWYADKPFMFRAYLDRQMLKIAFEDPETLTSLGFLESMGINGHNAHLDDVHPDRTDEFFAEMKAFGEGLHQYDDEDLDYDQRLTKEIVLYLTNIISDAEPFRYHTYPANQMFGIQSAFPSFMDSSHQVHSVEDAEHYLSRMAELPRKHEQYLLGLKIRENNEIIPPRFVVDRVLEQMRDFIDTPANENILYTSLADKLAEAEDINEEKSADILQRVEASITDNVYPAYESFIYYFSELESKAGDEHGYWHLPNGDAAYKLALRLFTTTDYTADEIHEIGLAEVDRIQAEMMEIFAAEGVDVSQGYTLAMEEYSSRCPSSITRIATKGESRYSRITRRFSTNLTQGLMLLLTFVPRQVWRLCAFRSLRRRLLLAPTTSSQLSTDLGPGVFSPTFTISRRRRSSECGHSLCMRVFRDTISRLRSRWSWRACR